MKNKWKVESDPRVTVMLLKRIFWTTFLTFHLIRLPAKRMSKK